PTAFVAYNDEIAVTLIHDIHAAGKSCPDDFSIVSHDNSFYSTLLPTVKLTSVNHPKEELGRAAAKWIVDAVEGKKSNKSIIFEPELVVRNSTKHL
ncbi:MAG: substrate-binding domain-containing protein, partial [Alkalibacterium sp.]